MRRYLLYSDVHFCSNSSIVRRRGEKYSARLHNLIDSISWAEHLAESEKCDEVVCLGDMLDRSDMTAEEITALQDVYFSKLPHTFITGNHEANTSSLEYSTAQVFKSIGAKVVTDVEVRDITSGVDLYFIPYFINDTIKPFKEYMVDNGKKHIVLSHNDLAGIQYGKFLSSSGFDVNEVLDNCTLFINGHLHNSSVIKDRIFLVGNLTGLNFNENARKYMHYAFILTINDDDSVDLDPYVNPFAYNFYKLYINSESDIAQLDSLLNNSILSVSCNNSLVEQVKEKLNSMENIVEYKIIATFNSGESVEEIDFKVEDHLKQFIEYVQTKIDPSDILTEELTMLGAGSGT